jgi:sulfite reductase alpha subunit-like flavoprotein
MITVVFASQTGTAHYYAQLCVRGLWSRGVEVKMLDIANISIDFLVSTTDTIIFIVSTSGNGQMPDSAVPLWLSLLNSALPFNLLRNVRCSILGLGDSSYEHFNYAAKKLHRRLEQLGASFVVERCLADEQSPTGIDDGYELWLESICKYFKVQDAGTCNSGNMYSMSPMELCDQCPHIADLNATVVSNVRMTPAEYEKDVRLVRVAFKDETRYKAGDIALFYPPCQSEDIIDVCQYFNWPVQQLYSLSAIRPDALNIGLSNISIFDLLKNYLDIYSPLTRSALKVLSSYCSDGSEGDKMMDMATHDYDLYFEYILQPKRTPMEVFRDFPSLKAKLPIEQVFDVFQPTRPRSFSIANWCGEGKYLDFCVALVAYDSPFLQKEYPKREGLASRAFAKLQAGANVKVSVKSGVISTISWHRFEQVLLIGAGTGIAPLRSIIHFLDHAKVSLYYGCRSVECDCLFKAELEGKCSEYHALGSRDHGQNRQHIDKLLLEHAGSIADVLLSNPNSIVILSGNNKLPKLVKATMDAIVGRQGFTDWLQRTGRFVFECW